MMVMYKKIFLFVVFLIIVGLAVLLNSNCCTIEEPMAMKYEFIPYPAFNGQIIDNSVDLNTIPRQTLINQNMILMSYIKKCLYRQDLIDYLYFNINKDSNRYKKFEELNDVENIEDLKKLYKKYVGKLTSEPIMLK